MRKIEKEMMDAITAGKNWSKDNTIVVHDEEGNTRVYLHGNLIFSATDNGITIDNCGWPSATTKSRLNALGLIYKFSVIQRNFEWYCLPDNHLTIAFQDGKVYL